MRRRANVACVTLTCIKIVRHEPFLLGPRRHMIRIKNSVAQVTVCIFSAKVSHIPWATGRIVENAGSPYKLVHRWCRGAFFAESRHCIRLP